MTALSAREDCRKQTYKTEHSAWRAMRRIIANATHGPVPCRIYWCPSHSGWHLTSKPKQAKYAHKEKGKSRGR